VRIETEAESILAFEWRYAARLVETQILYSVMEKANFGEAYAVC
jgi:hypothetical protein